MLLTSPGANQKLNLWRVLDHGSGQYKLFAFAFSLRAKMLPCQNLYASSFWQRQSFLSPVGAFAISIHSAHGAYQDFLLPVAPSNKLGGRMTTAALIFWGIQCFLEFAGCLLAFRRRRELPLLFWFLAFVAASDLLSLYIYKYHPHSYAWASWYNYAGHWLFLCPLACQVCGKLLKDKGWWMLAALSVLCAVVLAVGICYAEPDLKQRLLNSALAADMVIWVGIGVAWISRTDRLQGAWKWIAAGILASVGWDLLITFLWSKWAYAGVWLPVGEIAGLLAWNIAAMGRFRLASMRQGLGVVCEPTEVIKARIC